MLRKAATLQRHYTTNNNSTSEEQQQLKPFSPPWFCHGNPCPAFDDLPSPSPTLYSVRRYRRGASWARVRGINVSTYEAAYAAGSLAIAAYARGDNEEGRRVPSTSFGAPTLVAFHPTDGSFSRAEDRYDVSEFLSPESSPDGKSVVPFPRPSPSSSSGGGGGGFDLEVEIDQGDGGGGGAKERTTAYVVQFGGFATGRTTLSNAARLALALERDGLRYSSGEVVLALYDPPTRLAQRHNEVWLLGTEGEEGGEGAGGAGAGAGAGTGAGTGAGAGAGAGGRGGAGGGGGGGGDGVGDDDGSRKEEKKEEVEEAKNEEGEKTKQKKHGEKKKKRRNKGKSRRSGGDDDDSRGQTTRTTTTAFAV